jgi:hypothetical protein
VLSPRARRYYAPSAPRAGASVRPLNFTVMRLKSPALVVLLGACAHTSPHGGDPATCQGVGPDWKLRSPPTNAAELVALLNVTNPTFADAEEHDIYWFAGPSGQLLYCQASRCDGLSATFTEDNDHWTVHKDLGSVWVTADCHR